MTIDTDMAAAITAVASMIYAAVSGVSLWLLSRQIRDGRRFGAAPVLYALLKELEEHMAAVQLLDGRGIEDTAARMTIGRYLEFFERVEHLRSAGVIPANVLRPAFENALSAHLADPRFAALIKQDERRHGEILLLARHIGGGRQIAERAFGLG